MNIFPLSLISACWPAPLSSFHSSHSPSWAGPVRAVLLPPRQPSSTPAQVARTPAATAAPPFPPSAADSPRPQGRAAPFLPQPQRASAATAARAHVARRGIALPAPRPLFKRTRAPERSSLALRSNFALAHGSEAATVPRRSLAVHRDRNRRGPPSPSHLRPISSPR